MTVATSTFELPRDRYGRPRIKGELYERASSLGGLLQDKSSLIDWKGRMVAEGLRRKPELLKSGLELRELAEAAAVAGGGDAGKDFGHEVHALVSEHFLHGAIPDPETPAGRCATEVIALIESRFEVLASELTVASREFLVAGTLDLLLRSKVNGRVLIGDVKSGGSDAATAAKFNGLSYSAQMTAYAYCRPITEELEFLDWADLGLPEPDREVGVVVHVNRDTAEASLLHVSLDEGLVERALLVRAARRATYAYIA